MKNRIKVISLSVMCALVASNSVFAMQPELEGIPLRTIPSKVWKFGKSAAQAVKSSVQKTYIATFRQALPVRAALYAASAASVLLSGVCFFATAANRLSSDYSTNYGVQLRVKEGLNVALSCAAISALCFEGAHNLVPAFCKAVYPEHNQPAVDNSSQGNVIHYLPEIAK